MSFKLTTKQVKEIITLYKTGKYRQEDLSKMFVVSIGHICNIVNKKTRQ